MVSVTKTLKPLTKRYLVTGISENRLFSVLVYSYGFFLDVLGYFTYSSRLSKKF